MKETVNLPQNTTVYDCLMLYQGDFDIYDTDIEQCVTVVFIPEINDSKADAHTKFIREIVTKVIVTK